MSEPLRRTVLGLLLAVASGCADEPHEAPRALAQFAVGGRLIIAESSVNRVFAFDVLSSRGSLVPHTLPIEGEVIAARCLDANGSIIAGGDCAVAGALLVCTRNEGGRWRLWRVSPAAAQGALYADLDLDCADVRFSDRERTILVAPLLSRTGISNGLGTSGSGDGPAVAVVRWPEDGARAAPPCPEAEPGAAQVRYLHPSAPDGARAEALVALHAAPRRVERRDTPELALSFGSYVGVAGSAPTCPDDTSKDTYGFIDLWESDSDAGRVQVAFTADPALIATRRGSRSVYVAELEEHGVGELTRALLPLPVQAMLALGDPSDELLVLSGPDEEGRGRLDVVETERTRLEIRARIADTHIELPGAADTLTAMPRAAAGNATLVAIWNNQAPNHYLSIANAELVGIPGALAIRHYPVPTPFSSVTVLDGEHLILSAGGPEPTSSQLLSRGDGAVIELLEPGERRVAPPTVSGPYVRLVVSTDADTRLVFVSFDGVRTAPIVLPEPPLTILSNTLRPSGGSTTAPLRMALVFDNVFGELSIVGGIPPELRYTATGYLGAAVWQEGTP